MTDPNLGQSDKPRWRYRFDNYARAFVLLREAIEASSELELSQLEREGIIQRFEYTWELAWKTIKDYLEAGGLVSSPITPRQVLKDAFAARILLDGHVWIEMLDHRNLLSHTYDLNVFKEAVDAIAARYLPAMAQLHEFLRSKSVE